MSDIDIIIQDMLKIYTKYMDNLKLPDGYSEVNMKKRDQFRWEILNMVGELDYAYARLTKSQSS